MSSGLDKIATLCKDAYQRGYKEGATDICNQISEIVKNLSESVIGVMEKNNE